MKAAVITVSDRVSRGEAEDRSGPAAVRILEGLGFSTELDLVPDGVETVLCEGGGVFGLQSTDDRAVAGGGSIAAWPWSLPPAARALARVTSRRKRPVE